MTSGIGYSLHRPITARDAVRWSVLGLMLCAVLLLSAVCAPLAHAVPLTLAYPSFTSTNTSGFVFGGTRSGGSFSAYVPTSSPVIRASNLTTYSAGTVFSRQAAQMGTNRSFSAYFSLFIHDQVPSQGADGIAFVLQARNSYPMRVGGGLGFFGNPNSQPNSLGIEFDTFKNTTDNGVTVNDPNNNHIGVDINGNAQSEATASPPANATLNTQADGKPWNVWVDYNGTSHVLEVRMSKTTTRPTSATLSYAKDLSSIVATDAYVGFTAGTGGLAQTQDVQNLYFNNSLVAGGITPATQNYTMGPATVTQSAFYLNMRTQTTQALIATYRDSLGNPVAGASIDVTVTGGSVPSNTMITDASGQISIQYTTPVGAGAYDVHAVAQGGVHADFYITARTDYNVPIGAPSSATSLIASAALQFPSVTSAGYASVVAQQPTTQTPAAYPVIASYQVSVSDAVYASPVTVTVGWPDYYDEDPDKASEVKLLHYVNGTWVDVTTSVDVAGLTVTGNVTSLGEFIVSVYGEEPFTLSYGAGPGGSVTPVADTLQIVDFGSNGASVTAVPDSGYHFVGWDDGVLTAERRAMDVRADLSVTAFFESNYGALAGTVTAGSGATKLSGIQVDLFRVISGTPSHLAQTFTAADTGTYLFDDLEPGDYRVRFRDAAGNYLAEYYDDKVVVQWYYDATVLASATDVPVVRANISYANADLAPAGHLTGAVTGAGSNRSGVQVSAYQYISGTWICAYSTTTNGSGGYSFHGLYPGDYRLYFKDSTAFFLSEFYNNRTTLATGDSLRVNGDYTTTANTVDLVQVGRLTGTVTGGGSVRPGIQVFAYKYTGSQWTYQAAAVTNSSGVYTFNTLLPDTYRLFFKDTTNTYYSEYYNNRTTLATGDPLAVTGGGTKTADLVDLIKK